MPLQRSCSAYAEALAGEAGPSIAGPVEPTVPMPDRFIASDRGIAKARRVGATQPHTGFPHLYTATSSECRYR
ncbi:DUF2274 domain-containing protein [Ancylobacter tetraedralis]|uniref:DUF2274 domain-containing protein n=1 Tax=Ancylobacter tetraedralis TaxID=217068 RepID=UPI0031B5D44B